MNPALQTETYTRLSQQITDRGPWQQTCSGRAFFLGDPRPEEVFVEDIAFSLARQCRYNGHCSMYYSIAEHAVLISRWMERDGRTTREIFAGLHHDSAEAYTGDIVSQLKYLVPGFKAVEEAVETAVFEALGVEGTPEMRALTKRYDFIALATEVRDIMPRNFTMYSWGNLPEPREERILSWPPDEAAREFLRRHEELVERLKIERRRHHAELMRAYE